jgi:hypothetical protein
MSGDLNGILQATEGQAFTYRGWLFLCSAEVMAGEMFRPVVTCVGGPSFTERSVLPNDTDEIAYRTEREALRHAEQQAVRWVHDRTGSGQAQF